MTDEYYKKRQVWLEERGYKESDVMHDSEDREYVLEFPEDGPRRRVYLDKVLS